MPTTSDPSTALRVAFIKAQGESHQLSRLEMKVNAVAAFLLNMADTGEGA